MLHIVGCAETIQTPEIVCHLKLYVKPQREIVCSLSSTGAMEVSQVVGKAIFCSLCLKANNSRQNIHELFTVVIVVVFGLFS